MIVARNVYPVTKNKPHRVGNTTSTICNKLINIIIISFDDIFVDCKQSQKYSEQLQNITMFESPFHKNKISILISISLITKLNQYYKRTYIDLGIGMNIIFYLTRKS